MSKFHIVGNLMHWLIVSVLMAYSLISSYKKKYLSCNAASGLPNPTSTREGEVGFFHALTGRPFTQRHVYKPELLTCRKVP